VTPVATEPQPKAEPLQPFRPRPTPKPAPAAPPPQPAEPTPEKIRGLREFEALLDRKMKAVIICGDSGTGKSEIVFGFLRALNIHRGEAQIMNLRAPDRKPGVLSGTAPDEIWHQVVDDKRGFLDPSGEFFKQLSPEERRQNVLPDVTDGHFDFVKKAITHLAGVVLVVDLTRMLSLGDYSAWKRQEDDLNFVLTALRFLRYDKKKTRPEAIGFSVNMAQMVKKMPRIDKPVLVLFSKADQLTQYTNQTPFDLARRYLPTLHGALMTHAKRFRYDFCHTMLHVGPKDDREVDPPCGVLLSMEWLLRDPFRWLPFQFSTSSVFIGGGK
jgi:GTP-binding protein EngB required for normal cell division